MSLMRKLPSEAYNGEKHVKVFQDAISAQVIEIQAARDDLKRQCSPLTATWGLAKYEREVGIPADENKPIEQRRSAYIAKRRGVGTTTTEVIKRIVESFHNGKVEVIEHKKEFWLQIVLINETGIFFNLKDLQAIIEEIIPAHMEVAYTFVLAGSGAAYVGANACWGQVLTVYPYIPEPIEGTATAHIGATTSWGQILSTQPKEA